MRVSAHERNEYARVCICANDRTDNEKKEMEGQKKVGKMGGKRTCRVRRRMRKGSVYVAIIETMSVIILRIEKERQYKQSPYVTT